MRQTRACETRLPNVGSSFKRPQGLGDLHILVPKAAIMSADPNSIVERAIASLTNTIAERMKTLPGPPAEAADYRAWTEEFIKTVVSSDCKDRQLIAC